MATINAALDGGLVDLAINTSTSQVTVNNTDTRDAQFNVFNADVLNGQPAGSVVVWTYTQGAGTSATIAIPTTDNNGAAITWQVGQVTNPKNGVKTTTVTSPPWQLTMV